jgi:hypothetical protein
MSDAEENPKKRNLDWVGHCIEGGMALAGVSILVLIGVKLYSS